MSEELPKEVQNENHSEDDLFSMFPEGTRIFIEGNTVTFENMTPELLEVAAALNPEDLRIKKMLKSNGGA